MAEVSIHVVELELPLPGDVPDLAVPMRAGIESAVPEGHKLHALVGHRNIGMDMGLEEPFRFKACWRMEVTFATVPKQVDEPLRWDGDDS